MASEIEVVEEGPAAGVGGGGGGSGAAVEEEVLRNGVYAAAAYGDLEKLQRLVEVELCSVSEPDALGYFALQWAALNNRTAAAQYIIEVSFFSSSSYSSFVFFFPLPTQRLFFVSWGDNGRGEGIRWRLAIRKVATATGGGIRVGERLQWRGAPADPTMANSERESGWEKTERSRRERLERVASAGGTDPLRALWERLRWVRRRRPPRVAGMLLVREFPATESTERPAGWPREKGMMPEMAAEQRSRTAREGGRQVLNRLGKGSERSQTKGNWWIARSIHGSRSDLFLEDDAKERGGRRRGGEGGREREEGGYLPQGPAPFKQIPPTVSNFLLFPQFFLTLPT